MSLVNSAVRRARHRIPLALARRTPSKFAKGDVPGLVRYGYIANEPKIISTFQNLDDSEIRNICRRQGRLKTRIGRPPIPDNELVADIKANSVALGLV